MDFILIVILVIYSLRYSIVTYLDDNFYIIIKPTVVSTITGILLAITIVFGIFFNEGPGKLSIGFGNLEPTNNQKPHKYFDIDTYEDKNQKSFNE